jgi:small-conductance mechanosensitive channel
MAETASDAVKILGMDAHEFISKAIFLVIVALIALVVQRIVVKFARNALEKSKVPSASIFVNIIRAIIWVLAATAVLEPVFGISPSALMGALGVASLVVSLGLQDTISNVIGGLGLMVAKVVNPGDYISLNGITGHVTDVTWRHTIVKDRQGATQIIPNSVLNKTALTRLPEYLAWQAQITVTVKPDSDFDKVSEDLIRSAEKALGSDIVKKHKPQVLFTNPTSTGVTAVLYVFVKQSIYPEQAQDRVVREIATRDYLV